MIQNAMISLSRVEVACALRHLRVRRDSLEQDLMVMQERAAHTGSNKDSVVQAAILTMASEIQLVEDIVHKLWTSICEMPPNGGIGSG